MALKPVLAHASCVFSSLLASVKSVKPVMRWKPISCAQHSALSSIQVQQQSLIAALAKLPLHCFHLDSPSSLVLARCSTMFCCPHYQAASYFIYLCQRSVTATGYLWV